MSNPKDFHFFVDGKRFDNEKESLTGADIKHLSGVPSNYQLFEETEGEEPDLAISDTEGVNLKQGKTKHFFAVPPATFG